MNSTTVWGVYGLIVLLRIYSLSHSLHRCFAVTDLTNGALRQRRISSSSEKYTF